MSAGNCTRWSHLPPRALAGLAVALGILSLGGCCSSGPTRTPTGAGTQPLSKSNLLCDIQMVAILQDGTTIPPTVQVRANVQAVIWVADADQLTVTFPNGSPYPGQPTCPNTRFCGALVPPTYNEDPKKNTYKYSFDLVHNGETKHFDPQLEVVK